MSPSTRSWMIAAAAAASLTTAIHTHAAALPPAPVQPPALPDNTTPPVTDAQLAQALRDIERAQLALDSQRERDEVLAERQRQITERLRELDGLLQQARLRTAAALDEEQRWAAALSAAQARTAEAQQHVQRERHALEQLRLQQQLLLAVTWVRLELRPSGPNEHTLWLRNTNTSASIRVTFRRPALAGSAIPAPETRTLHAGQQLSLGTRKTTDRIQHEAAILGAEWLRGRVPLNIRRISSAEFYDAERRVLDAEHLAGHAASAERTAQQAHARAAADLRTARAAEAPHERAAAEERGELDRLDRSRQLLAAQIRQAERRLDSLRAYHERLLQRQKDETQNDLIRTRP